MHLTEPNFADLIQNHTHCLTAEGRSQRTIEWYAANLKRFLQFLKSNNMSTSVKEIGITEVRRFIHHLQSEVVRWEDKPDISDSGRLSPFSVQGYVRTIKAFWSWLLEEGYVEENPIARLKLPRVPHKVIATYSPEQIQALIHSLDHRTFTGFRNYTIILLLLDTGIRLSELTSLEIEDIDFGQSCLLVRGKGSRERTVACPPKRSPCIMLV
ncbi:tyrosine-type recombinase/integrase [Chloroflexota bacterium]